jgi:hypothetical protein
VEIAECRRKG